MEKHSLLPTGDSAWKCCLFLGMLLLAPAPSTAHGQQLFAGDSIRVRTSQSTEPGRQWTEGRVVRLTPDTLWYQASGNVSPISMENAEIQRAAGLKHWRNGLGIGAVAGGAIGALVAYNSFKPKFGYDNFITGLICEARKRSNPCDRGPQVNSRPEETAGGAVVGALAGSAMGFLVGKSLGRWERVELDQLTVGGGSLAVSMRIRR